MPQPQLSYAYPTIILASPTISLRLTVDDDIVWRGNNLLGMETFTQFTYFFIAVYKKRSKYIKSLRPTRRILIFSAYNTSLYLQHYNNNCRSPLCGGSSSYTCLISICNKKHENYCSIYFCMRLSKKNQFSPFQHSVNFCKRCLQM